MDALIMNKKFEVVDILDSFESFIWTERFRGYGDFEVYLPAEAKIYASLQQDYYLLRNDSDRVMIIEEREINGDAENGNRATITGRSLESILDRRIVWTQTVLSGNFQDGIEKLLNDNAISPSNPDRIIENLVFEASSDPAITCLEVEAQLFGEDLYDAVTKLCEAKDIGFKIRLDELGNFVFSLIAGTDRSYEQTENPYVVFSPSFDNILNSNYLESNKALKTVTLVAGDGEGTERKTTCVGSGTGLDRREVFTDAQSVSSTVDDVTLTEEEYLAQLAQKGEETLSEAVAVKTFEGQVDASRTFKYGSDFFMGDIVQMVNEYGVESRVRVIELVHSHSESGEEMYPTFSTI